MFQTKMKSLVPAVILSAVLAGCCCPHGGAPECAPSCKENSKSRSSFELVRENRAACSVVLPANASLEILKAVANFNLSLKKITGAELPAVKEEAAGNRIVLVLRRQDSLWTADNFTIRFPDERTLEIEGTEASVQWAFNHILREFAGAEWILPEECGLSYTPMKDLVIPAETIEVKDISWPLSRTLSMPVPWWKQNLRSGTKYFSHTLTKYAFPLSKYGKDNSWPAAIMPVLNGKKITALPDPERPRHYWQPCYSNPETAKIAVENILEYLEEHPDTLAVGSPQPQKVFSVRARFSISASGPWKPLITVTVFPPRPFFSIRRRSFCCWGGRSSCSGS